MVAASSPWKAEAALYLAEAGFTRFGVDPRRVMLRSSFGEPVWDA